MFDLNGHKLKGRFVLQRVELGGERRWYLIKAREEKAPPRREPVATQPRSIVSGLTVREVARKEIASQ